MKQITILFSTACLIVFMACNEPAKETGDADNMDTTTQTEPMTSADAPPMDSAAMMKAWQEYMTPGDPHKMLASAEGKWKVESTMWMAPDAPPPKAAVNWKIK